MFKRLVGTFYLDKKEIKIEEKRLALLHCLEPRF